jgi:hypothetical protein
MAIVHRTASKPLIILLSAFRFKCLFLILGSCLLVGCGTSGGTRADSGHGWFFIISFCLLAWFAFLVAKGEGMTFSRLIGFLISIWMIWHAMNWTANATTWVWHQTKESAQWLAKMGSSKALHERLMPSHSNTAINENPLVQNEPQKYAGDFSKPEQATVATKPPDRTGQAARRPRSGAAKNSALLLLQEKHDPDSNTLLELEWLEMRTSEIEYALLEGLRKATNSKRPLNELENMMTELRSISSTLASSRNCSLRASIETLRNQLDKKRVEFQKKSQKAVEGKKNYVDMLQDIGPMQVRAESLSNRLQVLKADADHLTVETSEWIELFRDTMSFKGEAAARENLVMKLREKEDNLTSSR